MKGNKKVEATQTEVRGITLEEQKAEGRKFCKEYDPRWPMSWYQGMCNNYVLNRRKNCGVPFVNTCVCKTGYKDDFSKEMK